MSGGGASDGISATTYYLTPLPPPGPLTVIVAWPAAGIAEQRLELDTEAFRRASEHAEVLWPIDTEAKSRSCRAWFRISHLADISNVP